MDKVQFCCPCDKKSKLVKTNEGYSCTGEDCRHQGNAFPVINGIPIFISESQTDTVCTLEFGKTYVERPLSKFNRLKKLVVGESAVTRKNCEYFCHLLTQSAVRPKVLVIGGAEKGSGTSGLWESEKIDIVSFDIYASETTDFVCDAHYIPINDNTFDGVWIQAVLEHVVEPTKVVAEIYRVLKPDGYVYAETPFMQQVHEGAYDFTRFTVLGHRYLFRDFELIDIGGNKGPELVLAWSIRYFIWALTRSRKLARIIGLGFGLIMRPFSVLMSKESMFDASSGVFFLGKKPSHSARITHKDLVSLYRGQYNKR